MTVPTVYSESVLADFMLQALGSIATVLSLDAVSFEESVNDVLLAYGVDDIADADDIQQLRALARVAAWKRALTEAASKYDVSDGTMSLKRSQLLTQIRATLSIAETDAAPYLDDGVAVASRSAVVYADDPYARVGGP